MKQKKKHDDKRQNTSTMKNKRTIASTTATYKPMKSNTNKYQKYNYSTQTDNSKNNNRNTDMSIGLKDNKKLKNQTMDQMEEKIPFPKEAATKPSSHLPPPPESEVYDSSSDDAMSEVNRVVKIGPDEASKVFSHLEEKQQIDPSNTSINNSIKNDVTEDSTGINLAKANSTLQERSHSEMESKKEEDVVLTQEIKLETLQVYIESEKQDQLGESVRFSDGLNNEYHSTSLTNDENNNPFISGLKLWQD